MNFHSKHLNWRPNLTALSFTFRAWFYCPWPCLNLKDASSFIHTARHWSGTSEGKNTLVLMYRCWHVDILVRVLSMEIQSGSLSGTTVQFCGASYCIGWLGHKRPYSVRHRFVEATGKKTKTRIRGGFTSVNFILGLDDRTSRMFSPPPLWLSVHPG